MCSCCVDRVQTLSTQVCELSIASSKCRNVYICEVQDAACLLSPVTLIIVCVRVCIKQMEPARKDLCVTDSKTLFLEMLGAEMCTVLGICCMYVTSPFACVHAAGSRVRCQQRPYKGAQLH